MHKSNHISQKERGARIDGEKDRLRRDDEWKGQPSSLRPLSVFLCHSSGDKHAVRELYRQLLAEGFDPWLDEEKLLPGEDWQRKIQKAVRTSDVVIVCLSRNAGNRAGFFHKEISDALDVADQQPEGKIFLIPLKLEECEVPDRLHRWQWANLFEERGYERLLLTLRKRSLEGKSNEASEKEKKDIQNAIQKLEDPKSQRIRQIEPKSANREIIHKTYTNSNGMKFALIPAGKFMMGSEEYEWEKPVHIVTISKPFYLGIYPVTQHEWKELMENNPSYFKGDQLPVENVSWDDVQKFIQNLNTHEGTNKYDLPSEAEWEYAVRAGTTTGYFFGNDESKLGDYAWYYENSEGKTHPVGKKKPNPWGLYDMLGNVWEWVQDKWHDNYEGAPTDSSTWECRDCYSRVNRGGSWENLAVNCRSAARTGDETDASNYTIGLRLMKVL